MVFDYGNNLRQRAHEAGYERAFAFPGFVPAYIRPEFCLGRGPFRWAALSGLPEDIYTIDQALARAVSRGSLRSHAGSRSRESGSRSRACRHASAGSASASASGPACCSTSWCASGRVKAPIVIGRDHLDCGSVASPNRETEGMLDGSDAISDWPLLNALVATASGA